MTLKARLERVSQVINEISRDKEDIIDNMLITVIGRDKQIIGGMDVNFLTGEQTKLTAEEVIRLSKEIDNEPKKSN